MAYLKASKEMKSSYKALPAVIAAALGLSGCFAFDETENSVWREDMKSPVERNIRLDVHEARHILKADGRGLAAGEAGRLGAFLAAQGSPWSMDVMVQPLSANGAKALDDVDYTLVQLGVQADRIGRQTPGTRAGEGDIAVTARHIRAKATGCPDWRRANLMDLSEVSSSNFGCATADNLARMIADPRELAVGRALAPAPGTTAAGGVARYNADKVKPLLKRNTSGGGGSGGGGGGGNGGDK